MHKAHSLVAAVFIAYSVVDSCVSHFAECELGLFERVEKFRFPYPFAVWIVGDNDGGVVSVEDKFFYLHGVYLGAFLFEFYTSGRTLSRRGIVILARV